MKVRFSIEEASSEKCSGEIMFENRGEPVIKKWVAIRDGSLWRVSGEGATLRDGSIVPNKDAYPFVMDAVLNRDLRSKIAAELQNRFPLK